MLFFIMFCALGVTFTQRQVFSLYTSNADKKREQLFERRVATESSQLA